MGLGKTIQVIILIYLHIKYSLLQKKKTLVLCPSSLINNWIEEFKILKYINESNHFTIITTNVNYKSVLSTQCIICSFTIFQNNFFLLYFMPYRLLILDEAQFIKNIRTNLHRSLLKIKVTSKFLLTGTPIENKMKDLFTLYNFIIPGFLNNFFNNTLSWIDIR
ncbi:hypothetical protein E5P55_01185 [Candidatus Pinguicoccus supinus]|uniref:Helicase ATP-binding domain-containing protein n=1 Tax=Candidatus Pinguicoccus supinus TaxID=2529394 RepID=A0A7T0BS03_9BACT|nr:hypothetical protein E5P55_01185 [Candidatus Pinguicoccus supinus]